MCACCESVESHGDAGVGMEEVWLVQGCVGGTHGSDIVSSAADVLWMSVVRGMREVGKVCEICMRLARVGVGGEWIRFGLYQFCENRGSVGRVSVFGLRCRWVGGVAVVVSVEWVDLQEMHAQSLVRLYSDAF